MPTCVTIEPSALCSPLVPGSCCHPQIVRRQDDLLGKERLSMREIMERLVTQVGGTLVRIPNLECNCKSHSWFL